MRHFRTNTVLLLLSIFAVACANKSEKTKINDSKTSSIQYTPKFNNDNLTEAYTYYIEIKNALVSSDSTETIKGATKMLKPLTKIDQTAAAIKALKTIENATDLKTQRIAFSTLSNEMEALIKGHLVSGRVYKDFCPMALKGGATWLSSDKEITNPYYGNKMLKCGVVKEIIQ